MAGRRASALLATGSSGRDKSATSSSASNTAPTQRKYRARGIDGSSPPLPHITPQAPLPEIDLNQASSGYPQLLDDARCCDDDLSVMPVSEQITQKPAVR